MKETFTTLWIPFSDGRVARVRIDMHAPALPTPLEVESPAVPSALDLEHVMHGIAHDEWQEHAPFEIGLPPVVLTQCKRSTCTRCGGFGWVPSKTDCDTDPCPKCSLPPH